ncbi:cytochrome P450 [Micromonospora sp. NPDC049679]|uniref:cytochrome P450 n=1 Tax=Micromonospora sp. NPDC049679 TaxID=3155920 RepID=UPI0033D7D666
MDAASAIALLMTPDGRRDPYPTYELLRAHGSVVAAGDRFTVVTGYAAVDQLLRDPRMIVLEGEMRDQQWPDWRDNRAISSIAISMLRTNPPNHTRMRRLAAGAFTARRIAAMRDVVTAQTTSLVAGMTERGHGGQAVDFMSAFAYPLPVGVICALLGVPAADHPWFRQRAADLTAVLEPEINLDEMAAASRGAAELEEYFTELIRQRRAAPGEDLITALVQAHDAGGDRLSGDELLANLVLLLVAGFETTTNLLGNGLFALLERPEQMDRLRADDSLAAAYVEEMLRFDSPVQLTTRVAGASAQVDGATVPEGSWLLLLLGAANHDPARFADPGRFDPDRPQNHPISFGAGAHYCLGAALARLEAQVAFPMLLRALPALALAGVPRRRVRLTLRGFATLPVRVG